MMLSTYYLVRFDVIDGQTDFQKILSIFNSSQYFSLLHKNDDDFTIKHTDGLEISFKKAAFQMAQGAEKPAAILVQSNQASLMLISLIKELAQALEYRIFDSQLGSFIPKSFDLIDVAKKPMEEKTSKVFNTKNFKPLYQFKNTYVYFAQNLKDNSIHLINPGMLKYFEEYGTKEEIAPEFSYQVAPHIVKFTALYDHELIPSDFYDYYQKSLKVINYSGMNVWNTQRKIFVRPFIYEYNVLQQDYIPVTSKGAAANYADKIRRDEPNLDYSLKRILSDLKLTEDYYRATVARFVEFDRDREGALTPSLLVRIFCDNINKEAAQEKLERGWVSLKDTVN